MIVSVRKGKVWNCCFVIANFLLWNQNKKTKPTKHTTRPPSHHFTHHNAIARKEGRKESRGRKKKRKKKMGSQSTSSLDKPSEDQDKSKYKGCNICNPHHWSHRFVPVCLFVLLLPCVCVFVIERKTQQWCESENRLFLQNKTAERHRCY